MQAATRDTITRSVQHELVRGCQWAPTPAFSVTQIEFWLRTKGAQGSRVVWRRVPAIFSNCSGLPCTAAWNSGVLVTYFRQAMQHAACNTQRN